MTHVFCAVDGSSASSEAASAAISLGLTNHAGLRLVGVVSPTVGLQPGYGARLRRRRQVELQLDRATEEARRAGLASSSVIHVGDPVQALRREAEAVETDEALLVHPRGIRSRVFTRGPRVHVSRLTGDIAEPQTGREHLREAA